MAKKTREKRKAQRNFEALLDVWWSVNSPSEETEIDAEVWEQICAEHGGKDEKVGRLWFTDE